MKGLWKKSGFILKASNIRPWWTSHTMAPSAVLLNSNCIRIYCGALNAAGISSIAYIDVDAHNPGKVLDISASPVLTSGAPGTFDDNGVFPGHAYVYNGIFYLYYTGFQLVDKIRYTNFGGLATSHDGSTFKRVSEAPILDRADEGLHVRAGQSILVENGLFRTCYSAGTGWELVEGKPRPVYDVFYQESPDGLTYGRSGRCVVACDKSVEHGLGRPQIVRFEDGYYVFFTRRIKEGMRYHIGCAHSPTTRDWTRMDEWVSLPHGQPGEFDSDMVYFPSVVQTHTRTYLFYCGNSFGKEGLGYAELE